MNWKPQVLEREKSGENFSPARFGRFCFWEEMSWKIRLDKQLFGTIPLLCTCLLTIELSTSGWLSPKSRDSHKHFEQVI